MANKKFWLGMLVIVLVFGMTVVGCGSMVASSGPDPRLTDGKGGRVQIVFTGNDVYWVAAFRSNNTRATLWQLDPRMGSANNVQINEHEDCTLTIRYRRKQSNDEQLSSSSLTLENTSSWRTKTAYLSNDERVEVTIP